MAFGIVYNINGPYRITTIYILLFKV